MDPITWGIIGIVALAGAIAGCNKKDDDDGNGSGGPDGAGGTDNHPDADALIGDELLVDDDALEVAPDPRLCPGLNGEFSHPEGASRVCPVDRDLQMMGDRFFGACGPVHNGLFRFTIDPADPLASKMAIVSDGVPAEADGVEGRIVVPRAIAFNADQGQFLMPFFAEEDPLYNGLALVTGAGFESSLLIEDVIEGTVPVDPRTATVVANADGSRRLVVPMADQQAGGAGILVSYPLAADGSFDRRAEATVAKLAGIRPVWMTVLPDGTAMIVHASGENGSSCVEFFDFAEGSPIGAPIDLPANDVVAEGAQIALSADQKFAVIPAAAGSLHVFDIAAKDFTKELPGDGPARGVAMRLNPDGGHDVYASFADSVRIFQGADLSSVASMAPTMEIGVGYDLGPIAVHASGVGYVSATARWWEGAEAAAACAGGATDIPCKSHIIAIDPSAIPTGAWSAENDAYAEGCPRAE